MSMSNQQYSAAIAKLDIVGTYLPFYVSSHVRRATTVHKFYTKKYSEFIESYNKTSKQNIKYLIFLDLLHYSPDILKGTNPVLPSNILAEFNIFFDLYILNKLIYDNIHLFINATYSPHTETKEITQRRATINQHRPLAIGKSGPTNTLSATLSVINQRAEQILAKITAAAEYNIFAILYVAAIFDVNLVTGEVPQYETCTNLYFMRMHLLAQCMAYGNRALYSYTVNSVFAYNIVDGVNVIDIAYYFDEQQPHQLFNLLMVNYITNATTNKPNHQVCEFMTAVINKVNPNIYHYDISMFISTIVVYKNRLYAAYYNSLEYYMAKTNDINTSAFVQTQDDPNNDMYGYSISTHPASHFDSVYPNYIISADQAKLTITPLCANLVPAFPYIINVHVKAQMFVHYLQSTVAATTSAGALSNLNYADSKIPADIQEDILLMLSPELILNLIKVWPAFIQSNFALLLVSLLYRSYNSYNASIQSNKLYLDRTDVKKDPTGTISLAKLDTYLISTADYHNNLFNTFNRVIEFLVEYQPRIYTRQYILNATKANCNYLVAIKYFNYLIDTYIN